MKRIHKPFIFKDLKEKEYKNKAGNYAEVVMKMTQELGPGVHEITVAHDDWCNHFKGGPYNCDPDYRVRDIPEPTKPSGTEN